MARRDLLNKARLTRKSPEPEMRFYFEAPPRHEAGFVLLKSGAHMGLEVTSGLGSARIMGEFRICFVPPEKAERIRLCRQAISQFLRGATDSHGQLVATFDEAVNPWEGELYPVPTRRGD